MPTNMHLLTHASNHILLWCYFLTIFFKISAFNAYELNYNYIIIYDS